MSTLQFLLKQTRTRKLGPLKGWIVVWEWPPFDAVFRDEILHALRHRGARVLHSTRHPPQHNVSRRILVSPRVRARHKDPTEGWQVQGIYDLCEDMAEAEIQALVLHAIRQRPAARAAALPLDGHVMREYIVRSTPATKRLQRILKQIGEWLDGPGGNEDLRMRVWWLTRNGVESGVGL